MRSGIGLETIEPGGAWERAAIVAHKTCRAWGINGTDATTVVKGTTDTPWTDDSTNGM